MKPDTLQQSGQHPLDLLAFYVNGTLAGSERGDVEAHLSACPLCRREVKEWEDLAISVEEEPVVLPDSRLAWERLERQIREERRARGKTLESQPAAWAWWRSPSLAWGLAATQFVLAVGLVAYLVAVRPVGTAWTTLGGSPGPSKVEGVRLQVVFQKEATAEQIAGLLSGVEGQIVSGPTAQGVYVIAVPERVARERGVTFVIDNLKDRPDIVKWVQHETG